MGRTHKRNIGEHTQRISGQRNENKTSEGAPFVDQISLPGSVRPSPSSKKYCAAHTQPIAMTQGSDFVDKYREKTLVKTLFSPVSRQVVESSQGGLGLS